MEIRESIDSDFEEIMAINKAAFKSDLEPKLVANLLRAHNGRIKY
jgi:predicted N-acetyltransferase YhbS